MRQYSDSEIDAAIAKKSLFDFVRQAWHVIEPGVPLIEGWHIDAICQHLEAVSDGRIRRLLINIPPGHMKSLLVSVFWPAWVWLRNPRWRALFGSYDMALSTRDAVRCRNLITSDWYLETFRPAWQLKGDQNVKTWYENTEGGLRMALAVGGKGTGFRGDAVIFDDPLNVKRHVSEGELEEAVFWWDKRMSSRLNNPKTGVRVGIMQRLHEEDLSGHILTKGGYEHVCLPTEFDPERRCKTSIGFTDPRSTQGELLHPAMFDAETVAEIKDDLQAYQFAGQHNQAPAPLVGGILKRNWFKFWYPSRTPPPPVRVALEDGTTHECEQMRLPGALDLKITSSDLAFKDKKDNDFVVMQTWATLQAKRFLLDQIHEHLSFVRSLAGFREMRSKAPGCIAHLIEDKANGPAIMSVLEHEVPELLPVDPKQVGGSKIARCEAVAPTVKAGNVYLPHPAFFPWVESLLLELCTFPKSKNDDRLDAFTQALNWLRLNGAAERLLECMTKM